MSLIRATSAVSPSSVQPVAGAVTKTSRNLPSWISSPSASTAESTSSRLTYVPLRLPTSTMLNWPFSKRNSAWWRLTVTSSRKISAPGCRPAQATGWCSRNREPALGPRLTTTSAEPLGNSSAGEDNTSARAELRGSPNASARQAIVGSALTSAEVGWLAFGVLIFLDDCSDGSGISVELVGAVHLDVRQIEPPVSIDSAGDKLVAVDEDELAGVKPHGPPACRPDNVFVSNVDPDPGHLPEIVDNHTALLRDRSGVDTHRHVYRKPRPRSTHGCLPPGPTVLRSLEHSTGPCWAHLANQ